MEPIPELRATTGDEPIYCPVCRRQLPARALHAACEHCLNKRHLGMMLELEVGHLTDKLELVPDRKRRKHIALAADRGLAYCGQRLPATRYLREKVEFKKLPEGICELCHSELGLLRAGRYGKPKEAT